jgi:5-hydroxyisourate hydrolase-like protein (transthyretin family)
MRVSAIIAFLALLQTASAQQPMKASIEGVVLHAGTEEPVSGAHVMLTQSSQVTASDPSTLPSTTTDTRGRFVLDNVDPGSYRLIIASNGFVKQEYGQRVFPGQGVVLSVHAGDSLKDLVAHLSPAGTLSGHVRDSFGNPAVDVPVRLYRSGYRADGTKGLQFLGGTRSDDRGEYRFYWLTPDVYFIVAGGPLSGPGAVDLSSLIRTVATDIPATNKVTEAYRVEFYRNAVDFRDATPVRIQSGDVLDGIDFTVNPQVFAAIHGRIIDASGGTFTTAAEVTVQTWSPDGKSYTYSARSYYNADRGTFDIPDLAPGNYTITVARSTPATRGSTSVTLRDIDLNGVLVQMSPPVPISGRVTFDPGTANATFELRPVAGNADRITGTASRDGSLKIDNVPLGDYWLICTSPTLFIQSAQYGTEDVLNHPLHFTGNGTTMLEIAISSKGGQVRGFAHDNGNAPSKGSVVVLVPNRLRERADLYETTTTDQTGGFTISNVQPGDYTVFAWEAIEQYAWFDPDLLARLESVPGTGQPIHVSESSVQSIDLRVIPTGDQR